MFSMYQLFAALVIILCLGSLTVALIVIRRKMNSERKLNESIMMCYQKADDTTQTINEIFKILSQYVRANEYAFYLIDNKNVQYSLKSIHYKNNADDNINSSSSVLAPHKNAKYVFPLTINTVDICEDFMIKKNGGSAIINMRINGEQALIQMIFSPGYKISQSAISKMKALSKKLESIISNIVLIEQKTNKIRILEISKQATKSVTRIISGEGILSMAINMFTKTIGAKGGFFLKQHTSGLELAADSGFSKQTLVMFKYDTKLHEFFLDILGNKKMATLNANDNNFSSISLYFVAEGVKQILLFKIDNGDEAGVTGFWYDQPYEIDEYQTHSLLLMFSKMSEVFGNLKSTTNTANSNVETLKFISTLVDDLSPYTVGFSSMMQHYSSMIAEEMDLPSNEIEQINLAAYLSNIGIAVLSYDVFLKKGKYSEFDYEIIKLHSEVGADIIEALLGNVKVANMVRYHHERIDGYGYPYGLKGSEIPIGAKILAVVQFFVATTSPRNFREASSYDEALDALKNVADSQLDGEIVNIFVNCIDRRRKEGIDLAEEAKERINR
jgi:HD-GYP domain-containing protein (c-di-GMP phosphodiesterase class II)